MIEIAKFIKKQGMNGFLIIAVLYLWNEHKELKAEVFDCLKRNSNQAINQGTKEDRRQIGVLQITAVLPKDSKSRKSRYEND